MAYYRTPTPSRWIKTPTSCLYTLCSCISINKSSSFEVRDIKIKQPPTAIAALGSLAGKPGFRFLVIPITADNTYYPIHKYSPVPFFLSFPSGRSVVCGFFLLWAEGAISGRV